MLAATPNCARGSCGAGAGPTPDDVESELSSSLQEMMAFYILLLIPLWSVAAFDTHCNLFLGERVHILYLDLSSANSADSASKLAAMRISSDSSSLRRCCCCFFFFLLSPTGRFWKNQCVKFLD